MRQTTTLSPEARVDEGVWVFIGADMALFALFFNVYEFYRAGAPELFTQAQPTLQRSFGLTNTLLLLTSSWFVVQAVAAVRRGERARTRVWLAAAILCGTAFCVLKFIEYAHLIEAGINLTTDDFHMYYFMFTGLHALHLLLGLAILAYLIVLSGRPVWKPGVERTFAGGGAYWHMVDLLWIVLFSLFYLIH